MRLPNLSPLSRQHLIDPDVCIRCNTCEEACPRDAIVHNDHQYAIQFDRCDSCGDCLPPCPTGAIDSWRHVGRPFTIEEQLAWGALPPDSLPPPTPQNSEGTLPDDVARIVAEATRTAGGVPPPWSAAHPYVGLFSPNQPVAATVTGNHRLTGEDSECDIRHIVLDFGQSAFPVLEGQSLGVLPPGCDSLGRPHHVRLYSVASPRDGERPRHNNLAITVKRVVTDRQGKLVRGIASNWLCDLPRGATVSVTGPYGSSFLMPNHPTAKLLMVCTGTGAAPMRAMTERRRRRAAEQGHGKILLFFGARSKEELPYFGPLTKLPKSLVDVEFAFSRVPGMNKEYVQDRILARADTVASWLTDPDTFVFICGLKKMEEGVLQAFEDVVTQASASWQAVFEKLRKEGRFHMETY